MVLNILTGYQVLGIVYLDQLSCARHTHISYHDNSPENALNQSCSNFFATLRPNNNADNLFFGIFILLQKDYNIDHNSLL